MKKFFLTLVLIFGLAVPKAGIKIGEFPLTLGYLSFAIYSFSRIFQKDNRFTKPNIVMSGLAIFNGLVVSTYAVLFGVDDSGQFASYLLGFSIFPLMFFGLIRQDEKLISVYERNIVVIIRFLTVYGLALFFFYIIYQDFFAVPYLTISGSDVTVLGEKNNIRGPGLSKLISTYNNGNIFGLCMIMMLPFYDFFERKGLWKFFFRIAIFLTFSRTIWIVILFYDLAISKISIKSKIIILIGFAIAGYSLLKSSGLELSFLFDSDLGGRASNLEGYSLELFPSNSFKFISEILPVSIIYVNGLIGLMTNVIFVCVGLFCIYKYGNKYLNMYSHAIVGVVLYLIASLSDGAAVFPPVMFVFWFIFWLGMTKVDETKLY